LGFVNIFIKGVDWLKITWKIIDIGNVNQIQEERGIFKLNTVNNFERSGEIINIPK
jgi:hypothetical protein